MTLAPFPQPIHITRPLLPDLDRFRERLEAIWEAQWLSNNGQQHRILEERLRAALHVPHLSLFNNGTIALMVAIQSLRLAGEVITTPFTFPATPHVLTWNNIKPIFCDIDPVTMNLDASKIEACITPQTSGILAVHVFGTPCDVAGIQDVANRYGLRVVYDAAHAFGVEVDGQGIGTFGDITMFSFHPTKLFHSGEGGALTMNDPHVKARIDLLKNFGIKNQEEVVMPGINGKMNELQAAMGLLVLDMIDDEMRQRALLFDAYRHGLREIDGISWLENPPQVKNSYQYFVIRIDKTRFGRSRDAVFDEFKKYNVFTRKYFYPLCSDYPCYQHLPSAAPAHLPIARQVVQETLSMPFYGGLTPDDVEKICAILKQMR